MIEHEAFPRELTERNCWVLWKLETINGRETKIPYQVNGSKADSTNPDTWTSYEVALKYSQGYSGVGFVLTENDPYTVIDLDDCIIDGKMKDEAKSLVDTLDSYTEYSQSGTGLHIFIKAKKPGERSKNTSKDVEIYDDKRFIVMTFDHLEGTPTEIYERQDILNYIYDMYFSEPEKEQQEITQTKLDPSPSLSDDEVLKIAFKAKNGEKFKTLYTGDHSAYGSQSDADQAFCNYIAFYTQNAEQIDRIFTDSGLYRDKWDRKDYKAWTIQKAIDGLSATYQKNDFHITVKSEKGNWKDELEYGESEKRGVYLLKNARNVELILENVLGEVLVLDEFTTTCAVKGDLPWRKADEKEWQSIDYNQLEHWLATKWNITGKDMINNAFVHVVHKRGFHPIKELIESVEWDKKIRVPNLFCDYLGAEHSKYTWEVTKRWFTGAVKRIYEPGCKFEIMPLLIGEKGLGKSEIGRKLAAGEWFTDSLRSLDPKVVGEILANVWICEFPELKTLKGKDDEEIKSFISSQEDIYRGAYERGKATKHKRHTVFYGTSNKNEVLTDETGERRRFPIKCSKERLYNPFIDLTPQVVAQIWAEAKVYYDEGYMTYIDQEIQDLAEEVFSQYKDVDPLEGEVEDYVENHGTVCVRQVWDDVMADDQRKKPTRKDSNRIVSILTSLGYEQIGSKRFEKYGKQIIYGIKN